MVIRESVNPYLYTSWEMFILLCLLFNYLHRPFSSAFLKQNSIVPINRAWWPSLSLKMLARELCEKKKIKMRITDELYSHM